MKWLTLYNKIGKQNLNKMKKLDVVAIIENKEFLLDIKYKADGTPYLVVKSQ